MNPSAVRSSFTYQLPTASLATLVNWLALAAVADWLITRTLTRAAIYMPKSPLMITAYQWVHLVGTVAGTFATLLALVVLSWIAWRGWQKCHPERSRRDGSRDRWLAGWLSAVLAARLLLNFVLLVLAPSGWTAVGSHLLNVAAIGLIALPVLAVRTLSLRREGESVVGSGLAVLLPTLALLVGQFYQLGPALYTTLRWPGPPPWTGWLFNAGELLVVLSTVALWWLYGRETFRQVWLMAALPALLFAIIYQINPAMTAILSVWSTGLTLYLPWPLYAASLWLAGVTVIVCLRRNHPAGWAILLLAAGGYAPQLSTQAFLGLVALWLLAMAASQNVEQQDDMSHHMLLTNVTGVVRTERAKSINDNTAPPPSGSDALC